MQMNRVSMNIESRAIDILKKLKNPLSKEKLSEKIKKLMRFKDENFEEALNHMKNIDIITVDEKERIVLKKDVFNF